MKRIILFTALLITFLMIFSCSKVGKKDPSENAAPSDTKTAQNGEKSSSTNMSDLPDAVFEGVKTRFIADGMTLVSLKRDMEDHTTILKAVIKETDSRKFVPKSMKIISENFSSIDKIVIVPGEKGNGYTISASKLDEIMKKYKNDGGDLDSMLWGEINGSGTNVQEESKPQVKK